MYISVEKFQYFLHLCCFGEMSHSCIVLESMIYLDLLMRSLMAVTMNLMRIKIVKWEKLLLVC